MERKGGEEGRRVGEGRVSVQEHKREGAQDRDRQFEGKKIIFSLTLCQNACSPTMETTVVFETPWDSQITPFKKRLLGNEHWREETPQLQPAPLPAFQL